MIATYFIKILLQLGKKASLKSRPLAPKKLPEKD